MQAQAMPLRSASFVVAELPLDLVRRALREARQALGADVAFLAQAAGEAFALRAVEGERPGWAEGPAGDRATSLCRAVLAGADPGPGAAGVPVRRADGGLFGVLGCASDGPAPAARDPAGGRVLAALAGVLAGEIERTVTVAEHLERARHPVWVTDLAGTTVLVNDALASLLGVTRERMEGASALDFLPEDDRERGRRVLASRAGGAMDQYETELLRADGTRVPVAVSGSPLMDGEGRITGALDTLVDLSERRRIERISEERFDWLADLMPQQIWTASADGASVDYFNARMTEFYGAGAERARGPAGDVHPDDLPAVRTVIARGVGAGEPFAYHARLRRRDGAYLPHHTRALPLRDDGGEVVRWLGITADLTAALAQERLAESEVRLREAHEIARLGAYRWTRVANETALSAELLALLGRAAEESGGAGGPSLYLERVHPDDLGRVRATIAAAIDSGEPFAVDHRVVLPDGRTRHLHARGRCETGADGAVRALAGTVQDVTEQRAAAAAVRGRAEAERASQAKSEFLSRMSHELRTPLNAILGFGQLLKLDGLGEDQHESVDHMLGAGGHLLALIDEVLEISRIEAGELRLDPEPMAIVPVVREVAELVSPLAAERDVTLTVDEGSAACAHVRADRQRVKQVLLNLLSNAIKYNRDGGRVTVRVRSGPGRRVRVAVSDTGEGLRPEELERVFHPFERLRAGNGTEGTGLGLSLSRSLAEAMGGELVAASEPGCGCDFTLLLDAATAGLRPGAPAAAPAADAAPVLRPARVLCVEDNPSNLALVERVLSRARLEVLGAPQGRLGLELARRHVPDVVLLDLDLPDLPGEAVLAALGAEAATQAVPVVICSADATQATIDRLRGGGAAEYLTKPLDVHQLLKVVSRLADGRVT